MANYYKTKEVTLTQKKVGVTSRKDEDEYPKATRKEGKYILPWTTTEVPPDGWTNFKFFFTVDESRIPGDKKLDEEPLMQLMKPDPHRIENPPDNGIRVTWLGHDSVLFQLDHVNILTNPNFSVRGIKYYHPGDNKRYRPPVYSVNQLPRIDCAFITNTHYDHLDLPSIRALNERFGDMLLWYVPMGVAEWMHKAGCQTVVELDWWKEDEVDFIDATEGKDEEDKKVTRFNIACTPSQNFHSRAFDDDNAVLWCSWVVISPRYKLFVSGATGYCDVFKTIGNRYGPFHMAALPIGGYEPKWKFGYGNLTPEEAVKVHQDLLAMCSLATSWGTFAISNEYYLEPPKRLNEELRKQGLSEMQFFLLKHGESRLIEIKEAGKQAPPEKSSQHGHRQELHDHHEKPHDHHEKPHDHHEKPDGHHEEPHDHHEKPDGHHEEPHVHHEEPHVHHEEPHSHHEEPHSHHEEPQSHHEEPHVHHEEPHSHHEEPHSHHEEPHSHHEEPHGHHEEPHGHREDPVDYVDIQVTVEPRTEAEQDILQKLVDEFVADDEVRDNDHDDVTTVTTTIMTVVDADGNEISTTTVHTGQLEEDGHESHHGQDGDVTTVTTTTTTIVEGDGKETSTTTVHSEQHEEGGHEHHEHHHSEEHHHDD